MDVDVATRMMIRNVTSTEFIASVIVDRIKKRDIVDWRIIPPGADGADDSPRPKVVLTKVNGETVTFHGGMYAIR